MIFPDAIGRAHAGCTIREGDRVIITSSPPMLAREKHGWWCYRECLVPGAKATMTEEPRYLHGRFQGLIRLDRQWSVHDKDTPHEKRYFAGEGRNAFGLFAYPIEWLAPLTQAEVDAQATVEAVNQRERGRADRASFRYLNGNPAPGPALSPKGTRRMAEPVLNYVRCPYCGGNLSDINHPCDEDAREAAAKEAVERMFAAVNAPVDKATREQLRVKLRECEEALRMMDALLSSWRSWAFDQYGPNAVDLAEGFIASVESPAQGDET